MTTQKRVSISLTLSPEAHTNLLTQAHEGAHRYPSVYASTLLERALSGGGVLPAISLGELKEAKGWIDEMLDRSSKQDPVLMADNLTDLLKKLAGVG